MGIKRLTLAELGHVAEDALDVLHQVQDRMLKPNPTKVAPTFTSPYVAELCKVDKKTIPYLAKKHNLSQGDKVEGSRARSYPLDLVIEWAQTVGNFPRRPADKEGVVVAVVNYKGGVAKTTTGVSLAQGLTLRGQKVLLIDLDGQGSSTSLVGLRPEQHVQYDQTIMPLIHDDQPDLRYAVQKTYWHNLSVIPAMSGILGAEFALPARAMDQRGFAFWNVLRDGIKPLRKDFDVIIFDTSPSLSNLTINAMMAADGLLMPCPPEGLDFVSSVQFWGLFRELCENLPGVMDEKTYLFMQVLFTKVKTNDDTSYLVKNWMEKAYGGHINNIEIPESKVAHSTSAQGKTIYDLPGPEGTVDSYRRLKEPMDRLVDYVLEKVSLAWKDE